MKKKIDGIWYTALIPIVLALLGFVIVFFIKPQLVKADIPKQEKCSQLKARFEEILVTDDKTGKKILKKEQKVENLLKLLKEIPSLSSAEKAEYEKLLNSGSPTHETLEKLMKLSNTSCSVLVLSPVAALWSAYEPATAPLKKLIRNYAYKTAKDSQTKDVTLIRYVLDLSNLMSAIDMKILFLDAPEYAKLEELKKNSRSFTTELSAADSPLQIKTIAELTPEKTKKKHTLIKKEYEYVVASRKKLNALNWK